MRLFESGTTVRHLILCGDARKQILRKGGTVRCGNFVENIEETKHVGMAMACDKNG